MNEDRADRPGPPDDGPPASALHGDDPYRTPPYGEPGPWAAAPPVMPPPPCDPWTLPAAPAPQPRPQSRPGRGRAVALLLGVALFAGLAGGFAGARLQADGGLGA